MITNLRQEKLEMEPEHNMAGFLGVLVKRDNEHKSFTLTQTSLVERIITALGLDDGNGKRTPAEIGALPADKEGEHCDEAFNYASVVGMLSYLSGHTRPELEFSVHQWGRYAHNLCALHERALKRIS